MRRIQASEAKIHFCELLRVVEDGESIMLTRRGKPVAILSPARANGPVERAKAVEAIKQARAAYTLGASDWKTLRDKGRP